MGHYINSHYNEAIVTDDEDSDDDESVDYDTSNSTMSAQSASGEQVAGRVATVDDPVERLRASLELAGTSLNEYADARKSVQTIADQAKPVVQRPKPRLLTLLAQAQVHKSLQPLDENA